MSEVLTVPTAAPPAGAEFSGEQWARIDEIIAAHRGRPGSLIPVLEKVQDVTAYLPESVQRRVAAGLGLPLSQVYGVVTFYSFFTMKPRGKHKVRVCLGTACHVAGGTEVLAGFMEKLDCEPGEMSRDGVFSLDVVRCLGACGLAPVVEVDKQTFSGVRPSQVDAILRRFRSGDGQGAGGDTAAGQTGAADATGAGGNGKAAAPAEPADPARHESTLAAAAATAANVASAPGGECRCGQAEGKDRKGRKPSGRTGETR